MEMERGVALTVEVIGAGMRTEEELRSLRDWLGSQRVRGLAVKEAESLAVRGDMGAASEMLLILGPGGAGAAVATALIGWLGVRRPFLSIKVTRTDGSSAEITTSSCVDQADEAIRRFLDVEFGVPDEDDPVPGRTTSSG